MFNSKQLRLFEKLAPLDAGDLPRASSSKDMPEDEKERRCAFTGEILDVVDGRRDGWSIADEERFHDEERRIELCRTPIIHEAALRVAADMEYRSEPDGEFDTDAHEDHLLESKF